MRAKLLALVALPALMALSACGDSSQPNQTNNANSSAASSTPVASAPVVEAPPPAPPPYADCEPTAIVSATPNGHMKALSNVAAVSLVNGAAYTIYISDFPIAVDSLSMFSTPTVPEDATMFTVAATTFNAPENPPPIAVGQEILTAQPFGTLTFTVTTAEGRDVNGDAAGARGSMTFTMVGEAVCGTINYDDNVRSISGPFRGPVKAL